MGMKEWSNFKTDCGFGISMLRLSLVPTLMVMTRGKVGPIVAGMGTLVSIVYGENIGLIPTKVRYSSPTLTKTDLYIC